MDVSLLSGCFFAAVSIFASFHLKRTPERYRPNPSSPLVSRTAGVGAAVLALRVHHTLGDGMSMVAVSRSVLEAAGGGELGASLGGSSAVDAVVKPANRGLSNFSAGEVGDLSLSLSRVT